MDDRSVFAGDVTRSVVVTGDGNQVRLTLGDSGVVLPLRRAQFRAPERRGRPIQVQHPRELDILRPDTGKLPFVGREDVFAELRAWLDGEPDISVHALTGRAGTGKTRLAVEFCRAIDDDPAGKGLWLAGFISPSDLSALVETLTTRDFVWERQTLLVLDYAAQCHKPLARWLDRLAYHRLDTKLRILLLEREAPENFGWWHELVAPALQSEQARLDLFHAARPTQIPDLADLEERRKLMAAALQASRALRPYAPPAVDIPANGADPAFDTRLTQQQFGNPLSLVMAGVIALDGGPQRALALRRLDAARRLGARELARLAAMAGASDGEAMRHTVAFNGLVGGLPVAHLRQVVSAELAASQRQADLDVLLPVLEQELPPRAGGDEALRESRLATIQPDLIGEAAIIEAFTGSPSRETEAAIVLRRAYVLGQNTSALALVRLVQDYAYATEELSATEAEKATARRVMDWLLTLAREITDPEQLTPLVSALPIETIILREPAAELTARLATFFQRKAEQDRDLRAFYDASIWNHMLGIRLGALGRHEEALAAAEQVVGIHRVLAAGQPDDFTPGLAVSLNTLALALSALGRREEALSTAEEVVHLFRVLVAKQPDDFTPGLAASLNTLALQLSALGRPEEAQASAKEAVRLYRVLAAARPDGFKPELARSLNTFGLQLADLGRREEALAVAEEAVRLYHALAAAQPDTFTPELVRSVSNLAIRLGALGRHKEGLGAAEEAVRLYRTLAEVRPNAFNPDLARSLNNLSARLYDLGRHEEALAAVEEAVRIRRTLAAARPDAFTADLAMSLSNLTVDLAASGRLVEALVAAEETAQLHRALAAARPDAFTPELARSLTNLAARLGALGRREEAVKTVEEAIRLRRTLAAARPDAFMPALSSSLWALGNFYIEEGKSALAHSALREGIENLIPAFLAAPAAFKNTMDGLLQGYLSCCDVLGREPSVTLLTPVLEMYQRLQSGGER